MAFSRRIIRQTRVLAQRAGLIGDGAVELRRRIERLLDEHGGAMAGAARVPGLCVVVRVRGGEPIVRSWGWADVELRRSMTASTMFQAMSISKPITAMAVCALARDGLIDLDAPVWRSIRSWRIPTERCGGFDPEAITVRRLLSHTAGLNIHAYGWMPIGRGPARPIDLIEGRGPQDAIEPLSLVRAPGAVQQYSGGGYALLEMLIEEATQRPLDDVVRSCLHGPLGMDSSGFVPNERALASLASRYLHGVDGALVRQAWRSPASSAGTGLYTTAADACLFMAKVLEHANERGPTPRGGRWAASMVRPQSSVIDHQAVGLGFHLWRSRSDTIFAHRGFRDGWWSELVGFTRRQAAIIVTCNGDEHEACGKPLSAMLRQCILDHGL